ncbi:hypothetical protein A2U01_0095031, partial [Trifolium medium]|nr:hypothetical protein [Trifolium medium]
MQKIRSETATVVRNKTAAVVGVGG